MLDHTNASEEYYEALALVDQLRKLATKESSKSPPDYCLINSLMGSVLALEEMIVRNHCKSLMED